MHGCTPLTNPYAGPWIALMERSLATEECGFILKVRAHEHLVEILTARELEECETLLEAVRACSFDAARLKRLGVYPRDALSPWCCRWAYLWRPRRSEENCFSFLVLCERYLAAWPWPFVPFSVH